MAKQKINDDMAQEMYRKYCEGVAPTDLAKQYGIARTTINSAFTRRGLKMGVIKTQKPEPKTVCADCPKDCRYLMALHGKCGTKMYTHCGYILFGENGSRGCDPGAGCFRYEPKKKGR